MAFNKKLTLDGLKYYHSKIKTLFSNVNKSISDEATRAKTVENTLNTNLNSEITRAKNAESNLNSNKVDKINGKGLSTNDLTDELLSIINSDHTYAGITTTSETNLNNITEPGIYRIDTTSKTYTNAPDINRFLLEVSTHTRYIVHKAFGIYGSTSGGAMSAPTPTILVRSKDTILGIWSSWQLPNAQNSTTVNGHTVNSDVPSDAKFTDTVYGVATSSTLGLVKSGTDITVDSSGNVSVNDDSHNHIISNVDGLQSALDGKAASSHTHNYLPLSGGTVTGATQFNNYLKLNAWTNYGTGTANFWYDANNKFVEIENATDLKLAGTKVSKEGHTHSSYVNQNAFSNVVVGSTTVVADSPTDTLTLVAGSNVTITPDATNDKITISSAHPSVTKSTDTTSTASPSAGGTFTTVDSVTRDGNGHVTKVNTKTVTLPSTSVTVDSALSSTSTNPVQNKVITNQISTHSSTSASTSTLGHVKFGTSSGTACQGNDSRLSDSRTPKSHASTGTSYGAGSTSNYGHVKLTNSTAVTDSTGLALPATEKNASIEGTLANQISSLKATVDRALGTVRTAVIDIASYNTVSNMYTFPHDGYVVASSETATSGLIRVVICDCDGYPVSFIYHTITDIYQIYSVYVKKGMKAYASIVASGAIVQFYGL